MKKCKLRPFIPLIALAILGFLGFEVVKVFMKTADISNLFNYGIGLAGLWVGWQSTRVTVESSEDAKEQLFLSKLEAIDKACEERDRLMQVSSDERDRLHDQEIGLLYRRMEAIAAQIEVKDTNYKILIEQYFAVIQELERHKAQLALAASIAEIRIAQQRLERKFDRQVEEVARIGS